MQQHLEHIGIQTDEGIIERILAGDLALFEVLIRRYNPVLYKIARSYGFNHQDAEDLMQDVHVTAYTELAKFEKRASYKTWISRIMVNRCLYKLKYGYFKNEGPGQQTLDPNIQPMYSKRKDNPTEELVASRELSAVLEKSLQNIPLMYRMVFVLRAVEEFSVAETADLLGITPVNVKVRMNRAKALLQTQMEQFYSQAELYSFNLVYCDALVQRVFDKIREVKKEEEW